MALVPTVPETWQPETSVDIHTQKDVPVFNTSDLHGSSGDGSSDVLQQNQTSFKLFEEKKQQKLQTTAAKKNLSNTADQHRHYHHGDVKETHNPGYLVLP